MSRSGVRNGLKVRVHGVVDSGWGHGLEEIVGMDEADGVSCSEGSVAQSLGPETPADAGQPQQQDVLVEVRLQELRAPMQKSEAVAGAQLPRPIHQPV